MKRIGLLIMSAAVLAAPLTASASTIAHWTFNDPALGAADNVNMPDSDQWTVWRIAAKDQTGNGNDLTTWESTWAGFKWVANSYKGDFSMQSTGDNPASMTWSAKSNPTVNIETITPAKFTVEAIFMPSVDGHRTIVGRDGNQVASSGDTNVAAMYFQQVPGFGLSIKFVDKARVFHEATSVGGVIATGNWYQAAGISDGTYLRLYLKNLTAGTDFELLKEIDMTGTSTDTSLAIGSEGGVASGSGWTAGTFTVGRGLWNGGHGDRFLVPGLIDEVAFSDDALTTSKLVLTPKVTNVAPALNATNVSRTQDLSWSVNDPKVTYLDLYYFTEPDPNLSAHKVLSHVPATTLTWDTGTMAYDTKYYWRVDAYEPNSPAPGDIEKKTMGTLFTFTTIAQQASVTSISPANAVVDNGANLTLTVNALNTDTYRWYKVGTPTDIPLSDGADYTGTQTAALNILDIQIGDEGSYYCQVDNATTEPANGPAARVTTKRLVGYWKLDNDLTDSVATVITGAATHDGTATAPEFVTTGIVGGALKLTGAADHLVTISNSADFFNFYPSGYTVAAWVNGPVKTSGWGAYVSKQGQNPSSGFILTSDGTGKAIHTLRQSFNDLGSGTDIDNNAWHLVVGTYDAATKTGRVYVDGVQKGQAVNQGVPTTNTASLMFGAELPSGTSSYSGLLDDVKIWNYPLTALNIADLYTSTTPADDFVCMSAVAGDINNDCRINLADIAELAKGWLKCNLIPATYCN